MISIILGILIFCITIPMKAASVVATTAGVAVKAGKVATKTTKSLASRLGGNSEGLLDRLKNKKSPSAKGTVKNATKFAGKAVKLAGKTAKLATKFAKVAIKAIIGILRVLSLMLSVFGLFGVVFLFLLVIIVLAVVAFVATMNMDSLVGASSGSTSVIAGGSSGGSSGSTSISADVQTIINMTDAEVWQLISEGKYSSYKEANEACKANPTAAKEFWEGLLVDVEVPCWKWADNSKTSKVDSTTTIKVNKHLAEFFKSYMTDIYNQPEQYVIVSVGGFSFRTKNNGTGTGNYSGHSFGATLDINANSNGMGSVPAGIGDGHPWKTSVGLSDPMKSECCTFDNSWNAVAKKYNLDWGGNWSAGSLDPMHFSLVGDNNKDTRTFAPKYEGRTP